MATNAMPTTNDITHIFNDNIHHHYLKYGEVYGNNEDSYPKYSKGKVTNLSFNDENNLDKASENLHHSTCHRT